MPIILNGTTGITTPGITNTGPFIFEGTVTVPQGTAATPSISVTAGLNTGIYFPSTSSIALTTAGTQRVLVNSSGNVGIGTSTLTTAKLNVIGTGNANSIMTETAAYIGTSANGLFIGSDSADTMIGVNNSGTKLTLLSRSGGVYSKALSIDDGGNILIGVNANANISGGTVELTGGSSGDNNNSGFSISFVHNSTTLNAYISGQKSEFDIATYGSTPMVFLTNNTERARIVSGGELLVNTTSSLSRGGQTGKIQVDGAIRATNGFGAAINVGEIAKNATASVTISANGFWIITNGANNSGLMLITTAGGATGVQGVFATNTSDIVYGTTTEPAGGNYLRIWMSGSGGTLQVKNINDYTGPYYMTPIATFVP